MLETDVLIYKYNKVIIRLLFISVFSTQILLVLFENNSSNQKVAALIIYSFIAIMTIIFFKIRFYKKNGKIRFMENEIFIDQTDKKLFEIEKVDKIKILYSGYKGKPMLFSILDDSGETNVITIWNGTNKDRFIFYLENELQYNDLKKLIWKWMEHNDNIIFIK
jgi:hypothetical protein